MNWKKLLLIGIAVVGLGFVSAPRAEAHGGISVGIGIGGPVGFGYGNYGYGGYGGGYYGRPGYYRSGYNGYYGRRNGYYRPRNASFRRHHHWRNGRRFWCSQSHRRWR